ncbi:hypothetical protein ACVBEH_07050, partial [Roseateles sp. GG27B]
TELTRLWQEARIAAIKAIATSKFSLAAASAWLKLTGLPDAAMLGVGPVWAVTDCAAIHKPTKTRDESFMLGLSSLVPDQSLTRA